MRCLSFFINTKIFGKKLCVGTCLKCLAVATPLINVDKINFTLVSIYGPNDDNPQFYENIMSIVEEFGNEHFI